MQCAEVADGFERHPTALALVKSSRRAQRSVYYVFKFPAKCGKVSGPPATEVDCFWLAATMA